MFRKKIVPLLAAALTIAALLLPAAQVSAEGPGWKRHRPLFARQDNAGGQEGGCGPDESGQSTTGGGLGGRNEAGGADRPRDRTHAHRLLRRRQLGEQPRSDRSSSTSCRGWDQPGPTPWANTSRWPLPTTLPIPGSDYYEIAVVEYEEKMHTELPPTTTSRLCADRYVGDTGRRNTADRARRDHPDS